MEVLYLITINSLINNILLLFLLPTTINTYYYYYDYTILLISITIFYLHMYMYYFYDMMKNINTSKRY